MNQRTLELIPGMTLRLQLAGAMLPVWFEGEVSRRMVQLDRPWPRGALRCLMASGGSFPSSLSGGQRTVMAALLVGSETFSVQLPVVDGELELARIRLRGERAWLDVLVHAVIAPDSTMRLAGISPVLPGLPATSGLVMVDVEFVPVEPVVHHVVRQVMVVMQVDPDLWPGEVVMQELPVWEDRMLRRLRLTTDRVWISSPGGEWGDRWWPLSRSRVSALEQGYIEVSGMAEQARLYLVSGRELQELHGRLRQARPGLVERSSRASARIPAALIRQVWQRARGACEECGSRRELQVDHRIARAVGGTSDLNNLQLLCGDCNRRKGTQGG